LHLDVSHLVENMITHVLYTLTLRNLLSYSFGGNSGS